MNKIVLSVAIALTLYGRANADEVMGYGSIKCRTLNGYYDKAGDMMPTISEQWVTGFFSGLNMAFENRMRDVTEESVAKLLPELKAFCKTHPDDTPTTPIGKAWLALPLIKS